MSVDLYSQRVLELAADIPHIGKLTQADGYARKLSRLCGSTIEIEVCLDNGVVSQAAIEPKACALGQASASILMRHLVGARLEEIVQARDQFKAMLKSGGAPPLGRFWELRYLESVKDYPPRHTSALLPFEAAVAAVLDAMHTKGIKQNA
ncbi:iron-sulfur cluster assembly scaffold protein [Candidatus Phycosocius spiralis]|uniref:Iron-sulfur cluster assembly scaffold protein n=1 Tax=Candidatus Phycosocius spiralis TaxID=2815099 RepID=A0ABQ4PXG9_9PROT|nr:iron-sulfur cluster assembly scaffold protein [Candidatus Phycosocius spiralis]GIU67692.1 iron-sulfur cluster assembly scaffold protein [Candidatus Phycosocius spiralis]